MKFSPLRISSGAIFVLMAISVLTMSSISFAQDDAGQPAAETPPAKDRTYKRILPHKALYKIKMISKKGSARVLNISGQMLFELKAGCEGWNTDHQFDLTYEYADSPAMRITSDFSTYETYDGDEFNFTSQRKRNGDLFKEILGNANLDANGEGQAIYTKPADIVFDLSKGTVFPMEHTLEVLNFMESDKKFFNRVIFDGSDEEGPVEVNSFIGDQVNAIANIKPGPDIDATLLNAPAWNVRMAFFPLADQQEGSDYEMTLAFHDNGIISDMEIDYKNFSVSQDLVALEKIESAECEK